jgi:competence protein ComEC
LRPAPSDSPLSRDPGAESFLPANGHASKQRRGRLRNGNLQTSARLGPERFVSRRLDSHLARPDRIRTSSDTSTADGASSRRLQPGDGLVGILALAVWVGARYPVRGWLAVGIAVGASALLCVRIVGWRVIGVGLFAIAGVSTLSVRSLEGQHIAAGTFNGEVTLLTDPQWRGPLLGAEARVAGKRVSVTANGAPGWRLARAEAGNVVSLTGRIGPLRAPVPSFMVARHLAGKLSVQKVSFVVAGNGTARFANGIRHRMLQSGKVLSPQSRALYGGFLLGDDRDQQPEVTDDFRAAGLTHLLVVSGQNVAFTLAVFSPLLMRLSLRFRFLSVLMILGVFAFVTRFEPSVLRAVAMAALVALSRLLGRPQHSARILALAVIAMLLIDPMLAWSVGFSLSVSACAGLALLVPWFERMSGPRWLVRPLATTLAAQVGASVVMVPVFGSVPVVAPLANMVALPAAAPIMSWGVAAGFPAGFLGSGVARLVHLPTELLLRWIAAVARIAAMVPLGQLDALCLLWATALALAVRVLMGVRSTWKVGVGESNGSHQAKVQGVEDLGEWRKESIVAPKAKTGFAVWMVLIASVLPTVRALTVTESIPPLIVKNAEVIGVHSVGGGLVRTVDVLVVSHGVDPARLLAGLRRYRIRAIGTLVIASGGRPQTKVVGALMERVSVGGVVAGNRSFGGRATSIIVPNPTVSFGSGQRVFTATAGPGGKIVLTQTG